MMLLLVLGMGSAQAEDGLTVRNMAVPQNGKGTLVIETAFESDVFFGYQLEVVLPKGLTISLNAEGKPIAESYTALDIVGSVLSTTDETTTYQFVATKMGNPTIPAGSYVLATMPIETDGTLAVGSVLECSLSNILFSDGTQTGKTMAAQIFTATVSDKVILDENSPVVPIGTDGEVDILVKRTIKANEWSTICLPFDMTEEQVKAAFGNDVQLAEFISYDAEKDGDNVTSITINFEDADLSEGFYGNYPYIIKTSRDITEFTLTANVAPDDAVAEYDNGKTGGKRKVYGSFIGIYEAKTVVPEKCLFLNGNKFYYSVGKTKMKAFRAYFDLQDVLSSYDEPTNAPVFMTFNNETTGIDVRRNDKGEMINYQFIYNLNGQQVTNAKKKGLYIVNNKKVVVK